MGTFLTPRIRRAEETFAKSAILVTSPVPVVVTSPVPVLATDLSELMRLMLTRLQLHA